MKFRYIFDKDYVIGDVKDCMELIYRAFGTLDL